MRPASQEHRAPWALVLVALLPACAAPPEPTPQQRREQVMALDAEVAALVAEGELERAVELADDMVTLDPTSPGINMAVARARAALAVKNGEPRLYADALRFADAALASDPENARFLEQRARMQYERRYFTKALADLDHVVELEPDNVDAYRLAARAHRGLRQPIGERASWEALLLRAPDDVEAHLQIGSRLLDDTDKEQAALATEHLARAAQLAPEDPIVLQTLAERRRADGDLAAAESLLKQAVWVARELPDRQADALFNLGALAQAQGRNAEARDYYRRAADLAPADARVLGNLGFVLKELGEDDEAQRRLKQARDLEQDASQRHRLAALIEPEE